MAINLNAFIGLTILLGGTIFWLAALLRLNLSYAYPFASLSYVIMLVASRILFDEMISLSRLLITVEIGMGVINLPKLTHPGNKR